MISVGISKLSDSVIHRNIISLLHTQQHPMEEK